MSSTENIEKRAEKHRKTERLKRAINLGITATIALSTGGLYRYSLMKVKKNKTLTRIASKMHLLDYKSGIFSSKLAIFAIVMGGWNASSLLASRDRHELRENFSKNLVLNVFYFVGDAFLAGLGAMAIDKIRQSKDLTKYSKVFGIPIPLAKSLSEIKQSSQQHPHLDQLLKISKVNYFMSLGLTILGVGTALPLLNQYITRQKVKREDRDMNIHKNSI